MKKTVVLLTLLCVLLVFQGVFAVTPPTVKETQEYTGSALPFLSDTGKLDTEGYDFYFCVYAGENPGICGSFDASKWLPSAQAQTAIAGINAGSYTVKYQSYNAAEQKNGNVNGTIGAEITPKKGTVTWIDPEGGYVYNGSAQEPKAILNEDPTIQLAILIDNYDVDDDSNVAINVGEYQALAIISDENAGKNYDLKSESESISGPVHDFEITPKPITFTWPEQREFVYNGKDQTPEATADGLVEGDELTYDLFLIVNDQTEPVQSEEAEEAKNVGKYSVMATVGEKTANYKFTDDSSIKNFKITLKPVTFTWEPAGETFEYNGKNQMPKATAVGLVEGEENIELSYILSDTSTQDLVNEAKNYGNYAVVVTVGPEGEKTNYLPADDSFIKKFEITPKEVTYTWEPAEDELVYNGENQTPKVTVTGLVEGDEALEPVTELFRITDEEEDPDPAETAIEVGKYSIIAAIGEENSNYMPDIHNFAIVPMEINLTWEYAEDAVEGKDAEAEGTAQFASHTYDDSGYTPLKSIRLSDEELTIEDVIKSIKINDEAIDYSADKQGDVYFFTFNEPVDTGDYNIEVELTEKALAEIEAGNYVVNGETEGTYSIEPADINDPMAVDDIKVTNIIIKNIDGDIVAAGTYPGSILTVNPSSAARPYTFDGESLVLTITLNGSEKVVQAVVTPESDALQQFESGTYTVVLAPSEEETNYTGTISIIWRIRGQEQFNIMDFYYIGDRQHPQGSFCNNCSLPATGFSSRIAMPLSVKPENLVYTDLNMSIQIPSMNMEAAITGVPQMDESWAVEWLGDKAGLLSGSHLPGEGTAVIAAHNTLNNTEYGPFALLSGLAENDVMFINKGNKGMDQYRVYANKLVGPNDMDQVIAMADEVENSLVLVTCENEATEGGYLNRRVVFAKPL